MEQTNMTRLSNYAKIIDKQSEYYGQVFEVVLIDIEDKEISVRTDIRNGTMLDDYAFDQIQFCVTKDNEPVKIGEEYACIGDLVLENTIDESVEGYPIIDFVEVNGMTRIAYEKGWDLVKEINPDNFKPLHPTNKIKITAEGKEYWISREQFKNITNTTN
jgi:hypothetical protein